MIDPFQSLPNLTEITFKATLYYVEAINIQSLGWSFIYSYWSMIWFKGKQLKWNVYKTVWSVWNLLSNDIQFEKFPFDNQES